MPYRYLFLSVVVFCAAAFASAAHADAIGRFKSFLSTTQSARADFEQQVVRRGGLTIYLGTDDENGRTSLGGVDLYPDVVGALNGVQNRGGHPFAFYRKLGFVIVGVLPDANGFGKPDIFMAKRVAHAPGDADHAI